MYMNVQRLYGALGIRVKGNVSELTLVDDIVQGLPFAALVHLSKLVAPENSGGFAYRIIPRSTYARRLDSGRLTAEESNLTTRLADIWVFARDVWGGDQEARAFLQRAHPLLDGKSPIDVAFSSDIGAQLVRDILGRLKYGSAA